MSPQHVPTPINTSFSTSLPKLSPIGAHPVSSPPANSALSPISPRLKNGPSHPLSLHPPDIFPISSIASLPYAPIHIISASQLDSVYRHYLSRELEHVQSDLLFPWLHGVDGTNYQQNLFFGLKRRALLPKYRGMMIVHVDGQSNGQVSSAMSPMAASALAVMETSLASLAGSVHIDDILVPGEARFLDTVRPNQASLQPANGINLRNFSIQVAKYATISDIVVVGPHARPDDVHVLHAAERIARAQTLLWEERERQRLEMNHNGSNTAAGSLASTRQSPSELTWRYSSFVLTEPFSELERNFPLLIGVDSTGANRNRINFIERERQEMVHLTRASAIATNVYLGNSEDVGVMKSRGSSDPLYEICIEAHDLADIPDDDTLQRAAAAILSPSPPPLPIHLEVVSTGAATQPSQLNQLIKRTIALCTWVHDMAVRHRKKVLIHCSDGYTETTLFALTYLMVEKGEILAEAYLDLQHGNSLDPRGIESAQLLPGPGVAVSATHFGRSFFLHSCDLALVKRIEAMAHYAYCERVGREKRFRNPQPGLPSPPLSAPNTPQMGEAAAADLLVTARRDLRIARENYDWFYANPRFDGSVPSRILPQLYLGSLAHAGNVGLLRSLGITHVVSVGEDPCLPLKGRSRQPLPGLPGLLIPSDENEEQGFEHLFLENLYDDGIDALSPHISTCIDYIRNAIGEGHHCETNNRILIHCRVGVSRSATIAIAYVLSLYNKEKRRAPRISPPGAVHNLTLSEAYLLVRARRLNVIIQPNLRFMYELLIFEGELRRQRALAEGKTSGPWRSMGWVELAREIEALNKLYIPD